MYVTTQEMNDTERRMVFDPSLTALPRLLLGVWLAAERECAIRSSIEQNMHHYNKKR